MARVDDPITSELLPFPAGIMGYTRKNLASDTSYLPCKTVVPVQ